MGVLNHGTYPSVASATAALCRFGVDAHEAGHDLTKLAALMNKSDPTQVNVTLARRHYLRSAPFDVMAPDVRARLAQHDPKDSLLVLVAHDDCDSNVVLTLDEMKEALK